jgi:hypothetical protein
MPQPPDFEYSTMFCKGMSRRIWWVHCASAEKLGFKAPLVCYYWSGYTEEVA